MIDEKTSRPLVSISTVALNRANLLKHDPPSNENGPEIKRTRACDNCRALKVKCVPSDLNNLLGCCVRCQKSKKECIFKLGPRKRRRRTDMRVSELEKRLEVLTATLDKDSSEVESRVSETEPEVPTSENQHEITTSYPASQSPAEISRSLSPMLMKTGFANSQPPPIFSQKLQLPNIQSLTYPPTGGTSLLPPVQLLSQHQRLSQAQSSTSPTSGALGYNYRSYDNGYLPNAKDTLHSNVSLNMAFTTVPNLEQPPLQKVASSSVQASDVYNVAYRQTGNPSTRSVDSISEAPVRESSYSSEMCDVDSIPERIIFEEAAMSDASTKASSLAHPGRSPEGNTPLGDRGPRIENNSDHSTSKASINDSNNTDNDDTQRSEIVRERVMRSWIYLSRIADTRMKMLDTAGSSFAYPLGPHNDVIANGTISMKEAQVRLDHYRDRISPRFYVLPIPAELTVEEFRQNRPLLFLGIMNTASIVLEGPEYLDSSFKLLIINFRTLMNEVVVVGNKSFEVLQCLVLTILWYNSPELYHHQKAYMFNFITASIANDLGISGSYEGPIRAHSSFKYDKIIHPYILSDPRTKDCRRLWLCIYFSSINTCLLNRRQTAVGWNEYTEECCQVLESEGSPHFDIKLAKFARLMESLEAMTKTFHSTDVRPPLDFNDPRTRYLVNTFKKKLDLVYEDKRIKMDYILEVTYHSLLIYLHETSIYCLMHDDNSRTPFSEYALNYNIKLTPAIIEAISYLTDSSTKCIEAFGNLTIQELSVLPIYYYARMAFSASMVLKLRALCYVVPGFSDICPLNDSDESLKLLAKLEDKLEEVRHQIPFANSAATFTFILRLLVFHYDKQILIQTSQLIDDNSGEKAAYASANGFGDNINSSRKSVDPLNAVPAIRTAQPLTRYNVSKNINGDQDESTPAVKTEFRGFYQGKNGNGYTMGSSSTNVNTSSQPKVNNEMNVHPSHGGSGINSMFNTGTFNDVRSYPTFSLSELASSENASNHANMTANPTESINGFNGVQSEGSQNEEENMSLESLMKGDDFWSDLIPSLESFAGFDA
ncbi:hypothetical protein NADFUDRAFT_66263 [Nadsonia fulvescens var. elongata DSM 6958]|uniref:Zn(2)-C6 fungal-type domain-containing protein n=1 Tax=Nadsonia fulvescens var. elongata DSM 6958 TaxID=857566 RepID=A0A1E3PIP1_9ASCO|nr:hypothetical protein NADFUDRAFT_66263 [Nadsonia fulvescens var. elongata DSM 6958]